MSDFINITGFWKKEGKKGYQGSVRLDDLERLIKAIKDAGAEKALLFLNPNNKRNDRDPDVKLSALPAKPRDGEASKQKSYSNSDLDDLF